LSGETSAVQQRRSWRIGGVIDKGELAESLAFSNRSGNLIERFVAIFREVVDLYVESPRALDLRLDRIGIDASDGEVFTLADAPA
jgi:hypothetical protein